MVQLRWRLAGDDAGQGALFDADALLDRHVGTGEFAGTEFLHVNAQRLINRVPAASRMPFEYTINAYRGCSHACVYCLWGPTPILMGDGRMKPISDLSPGDIVYGTERIGTYRRLVRTPVSAHWRSVKPAYEVQLADGTRLIASGDHRFLTERGWKHVTGAGSGPGQRPHLTTGNRLIGVGALAEVAEPDEDYLTGYVSGTTCQRDVGGVAIKFKVDLRVTQVRPLNLELPMFDITTGTGDFIANGVVSHNCFARPTHEYLGLNIGEDFERKIVVKINAVEKVRAELAGRRWAGAPIAMGTNTDPYQRCEGKYRLTRGIIAALIEARNPFSILTKSTLVLRDLDLLQEAARLDLVRVSLSIGTLDEKVWKETEPGTPHPRQRVTAIRRLSEAGIPCGVLVAPVIPGLSDRPDQVAEVVRACRAAGASSASPIQLHLRPGVKEHYLGWLAHAHPELMDTYQELYRGRSYLAKGPERRAFTGHETRGGPERA